MEYQIEKAKKMLELAKEQKLSKTFLPLNLQFFADDTDPGDDEDQDNEDDDNADDEDQDSEPSLEQMIKDNPALKKQFNTLFKSRFDKRLKGVDLQLAKKLIKAQGEQSGNDDNSEDNNKADEVSVKAQKLDNRIKRTAVKEYAVDNDLNPKLLARLVANDLDKLELDEDGEIDSDDLEELVDKLTEEFPELFRKAKDEDQDEDEDEDKKSRSHKVGSKKKTNKPKDKDLREAGKAKALERAKRKGLIKE